MIDKSSIVKTLQLEDMTHEDQLQVLASIEQSIKESKAKQREQLKSNVDFVVEALRNIKADIENKFSTLDGKLVTKVDKIIQGKEGLPGKDGKNGKDGRPGRDGKDGKDGKDGVNGKDGIGVSKAKIDIDGELVITLTDGKVIEAGKVFTKAVAEKIRVFSNADNRIPELVGQAGKILSNNGTNVTWIDAGSGSGTVTSVAVSGGTTGLTTSGGPITSSGTITLAGTLAAANGGTGQSSYTTGDLLYASGSSALSPLNVGANTYMLVSNGSVPAWTNPSLVTVGFAGFATNSTNTYNLIGGAANRIPYQSGSGVTTFLAAPSTANTFLGYNGSALAWTNTLTNPTITNYTETLYAPSAGTAFTIDLTNGTVQKITSNGNLTITLPASSAGKSYVIMVSYGGAHTLTWAGGSTIKWAGGTTPTATSTSGKVDVFTFFCDGTNTYGQSFGLNY